MNFDAIWKAIEEDETFSSKDFGVVRRRVLPTGRCNLYIGTEKPSGRRVLMLCLSERAVRQSDPLPKTKGIEAHINRLPDDPPHHTCIIITLNDPTSRDIFTILASDIAAHVSQTVDDRHAMEQLLSRLIRWQKFLERFGPEGLSENAQRGLFGELWFIHHYLLNILGPERIAAWVGPEKAAQDFQLSGLAVEVKTSTAKEHQKLHISGEKQLETSADLDIILYHLSLHAAKQTGASLVELIANIRSRLSENPLTLVGFNERLHQSGYLDIHEHRYAENGYVVRKQHFFKVTDNFPRITGAELRSGVGDIEYTISVAECKHYEITEEEFISTMKRTWER